MENTEKWKNIPNSNYAVSSIGRVKRIPFIRLHNINKAYYLTKDKFLTPNNNNSKKYWRIKIWYLDGTAVVESIHRLVAKVFIPNPENKPQVNHIDGNKDNNNVENLEWVTNQENNDHKFMVLGRFTVPRGSKNPTSKLTEEDVAIISKRIKNKDRLVDIAKDFNVGKTTISEIKAGRSWSHLGYFPYKKCKKAKYDRSKLEIKI